MSKSILLVDGLTNHFLRARQFQPNDEINTKLARKIAEYVTESIIIPSAVSDTITFRNMYVTRMQEIMIMIDGLKCRERALTSSIDEIIREYYDEQDREHEKEEIKQEPNCDKMCPNCHKRKVFRTAIQKNAIDEFVSIFFKCLDCGHGF